jgi:UDP-3-O-[3-hydroxymyristoyl] N-acetylglucosamine deacetylase/3-hydroxyacyl-[acyl-carrier-protein] dehydratase
MAQAGGVLCLNSFPDPENYLTFFAKIDNAKFKLPVVPGDTLIFKLELLSPIRRGIMQMKGQAFVDGKLTCEAELLAKIIKKSEA